MLRTCCYLLGLLLAWGCSSSERQAPAPIQVLIEADESLRSQIDRVEIETSQDKLAVAPKPGENGAGRSGWPMAVAAQPIGIRNV